MQISTFVDYFMEIKIMENFLLTKLGGQLCQLYVSIYTPFRFSSQFCINLQIDCVILKIESLRFVE